MRINHLIIGADHLKKSTDFYTEVLSFKHHNTFIDTGTKKEGNVLTRGPADNELEVLLVPFNDERLPSPQHIAFEVSSPDFDSIFKTALDKVLSLRPKSRKHRDHATMLKIFGLILILTASAWANEPEKILVVQNGRVQTIEFKNLKRVELETLNHHPKFIGLGKIKYSGFLVRDILKDVNPESTVTILGNTGQFSVELKARELLAGNNILATTPVSENGNQIIYDEVTLAKYPHLKQRSYWCWWVRSFIADDKIKVSAKGEKKVLY